MKAKKRYVDRYVGTTPKEEEEFEDSHKKVFEIFSKTRFDRILDVGCGDGNFSVLLGKTCSAKEVYGLEISEKGVELAKKNGVKAFQLDIDEEDFPFEDNYFDAVSARELIEHLFDVDHFLDEVYRVLKPRTMFVSSTPNLGSIYNRIALLLGFQPYSVMVSLNNSVGHLGFSAGGAAPDHIRFFTLRSLKELLKIHKFDILDVKGSCAMLPKNMRFSPLVSAMDKAVSLFPSLSYRCIVVSTKRG